MIVIKVTFSLVSAKYMNYEKLMRGIFLFN